MLLDKLLDLLEKKQLILLMIVQIFRMPYFPKEEYEY